MTASPTTKLLDVGSGNTSRFQNLSNLTMLPPAAIDDRYDSVIVVGGRDR